MAIFFQSRFIDRLMARAPYIDLRENPEKIADIPEARDLPELQQFFHDINGADSFFRTLGCLTIRQETPDPNLPFEMRSYIDITFVPWDLGTSAINSFVVFYDFTNFIHRTKPMERSYLSDNVRVILNLKPSQQRDLKITFWSMEWWVISLGKTVDDAREGWRLTLDLLRQLLLEISPRTKQEYEAEDNAQIKDGNTQRDNI